MYRWLRGHGAGDVAGKTHRILLCTPRNLLLCASSRKFSPFPIQLQITDPISMTSNLCHSVRKFQLIYICEFVFQELEVNISIRTVTYAN